jgi:hypothetical protein
VVSGQWSVVSGQWSENDEMKRAESKAFRSFFYWQLTTDH